MSELLSTERIVGLAILILLAEAAVILAYRRKDWRRHKLVGYLAGTLAGLFLLLAFRASLHADGDAWILAFLAGGLVAHLADLWVRVRS